MANSLNEFQTYNKEQVETATTSSASFVNSLQTINAETTNYSKKSLEDGAAFLEKLLSAKSFESAIQIQSEYAKAFYEAFIAQSKKIAELYSNLAKEAFKPVETLVAKVQSSKE
ncbi:MAG: phasin family protein [Methylocella sp.]